MKNILYITFILLLTSCFKEEDKRAQKNTVGVVSMPLGEDYGNVFYYNLLDSSIVSQNKWSDWDLSFYAQDDDYYIKLNDAANMKAFKAPNNNFESVNSVGSDWEFIVDDATGNKDNHALQFTSKYTSNDTTYYEDAVYVLLLGSDALGNELGYKKLSLLYTYLNQYHIQYANLDNTENYEFTISKDVTVNYVHFTFNDEGAMKTIEPDKTTWDIVFTRSTDVTYTLDSSTVITDYSVTSVLLNPFSTEAYLQTDEEYEDYTFNKIDYTQFTNQLNIIGYNWKAYDLTTGVYATRTNQFYIIKDINDYYYKFKFLSFYDPDSSLKGTISFEYEIIK